MHLREYLKKNKITQKGFARILGISKCTLNLYINSQYKVPFPVKIAVEFITKGAVTMDDWEKTKE